MSKAPAAALKGKDKGDAADADPAPPATLVVFGAMGDLAKRLLAPALVNLTRDKLLGKDFHVLGVSRGDGSDDDLRESLGAFVEDGGKAWSSLRARIRYLTGDFDDDATYSAIAGLLKGNAAFYLATAPDFFGPVIEKLGAAGLLDEKDGFRRIAIEKPFGHDLASARALNALILEHADETQVYRIDHFLGKETVQNIMVARFGNALLEAVMNSRYVDHVQITAAETVGIGTRGAFYDATGALRDMVPNHLFQLLAMIGMEPPNSFDADAIRNEKAKLLAAVRGPTAATVKDDAVRGRYTAGKAGGGQVPRYLAEADVAKTSRTETYAALKLSIETWRWAGVPFYLRTGKALAARDSEIVVQFKPIPFALFEDTATTALPVNRLVFQIQPDEGIRFTILAKRPGPLVDVREVGMDFRYADVFELGRRTGYETLLYDLLIGDQTLFQRADMIEAGWAAVQPILDAWKKGKPEEYRAGSAGPAGADALLARDGHQWHALG